MSTVYVEIGFRTGLLKEREFEDLQKKKANRAYGLGKSKKAVKIEENPV